MGVALGGAIAVLTSRVVLPALGSASTPTLFYSPLHSDGLLVGCALGLAYAWRWLPSPEALRRVLGPAVLVAAAVFLVVPSEVRRM